MSGFNPFNSNFPFGAEFLLFDHSNLAPTFEEHDRYREAGARESSLQTTGQLIIELRKLEDRAEESHRYRFAIHNGHRLVKSQEEMRSVAACFSHEMNAFRFAEIFQDQGWKLEKQSPWEKAAEERRLNVERERQIKAAESKKLEVTKPGVQKALEGYIAYALKSPHGFDGVSNTNRGINLRLAQILVAQLKVSGSLQSASELFSEASIKARREQACNEVLANSFCVTRWFFNCFSVNSKQLNTAIQQAEQALSLECQ